ncbi:MAG: VWA domain-containing protein [Bryobacterales bacterium]|nr:VWA domain-containing protein [Bryobacterales bacterium]
MSIGVGRREVIRTLAGIGSWFASPLSAAPDFHTAGTQVLIPFTAVDKHDHLVDGLAAQDFRLLIDGKEQSADFFAMEDGPVSLMLVLDASGSMNRTVTPVQDAVRRILRSSDSNDEFAVIEFSDQIRLTVDFTRLESRVESRVREMAHAGSTSFSGAILVALREMNRVRQRRRALIVVSDGRDNHSRHVRSEVIQTAVESDVRIYAIELYPPMGEAFVSPTLLEMLARSTGGRYLPTMARKQIPELIDRIDIHRNYVLGFTPPVNHRDGRNHSVDLRLRKRSGIPPARLFWKERYRVPATH